MLVLFCVLNEEVQEAWKLACLGKKGQSEEAARSTQVGESESSPGWAPGGVGRREGHPLGCVSLTEPVLLSLP